MNKPGDVGISQSKLVAPSKYMVGGDAHIGPPNICEGNIGISAGYLSLLPGEGIGAVHICNSVLKRKKHLQIKVTDDYGGETKIRYYDLVWKYGDIVLREAN